MALTRYHPFYRDLPYTARTPDLAWFTGSQAIVYYEGFTDTSGDCCITYKPLFVMISARCCQSGDSCLTYLDVSVYSRRGKRYIYSDEVATWYYNKDVNNFILLSDFCLPGSDLPLIDSDLLSNYQARLITSLSEAVSEEGFTIEQTTFWDMLKNLVCPCPPGTIYNPSTCTCEPPPECPVCFIASGSECDYDPTCAEGGPPISEDPEIIIIDPPPGINPLPGGFWLPPPGWSPPEPEISWGCWTYTFSSPQPQCNGVGKYKGASDWSEPYIVTGSRPGCSYYSDLHVTIGGVSFLLYTGATCSCNYNLLTVSAVFSPDDECVPDPGFEENCRTGMWELIIKLEQADISPIPNIIAPQVTIQVPGRDCGGKPELELDPEGPIWMIYSDGSNYPLNLSLSAQLYYAPKIIAATFIAS